MRCVLLAISVLIVIFSIVAANAFQKRSTRDQVNRSLGSHSSLPILASNS